MSRLLAPGGAPQLLMQRPTKFEMTIDLTTAKSLGLTNPQSILLRTDQVIERQYSLLRCMSP
jgi:putative ABC transport system substrate-binding protein